MHQVLFSIGPFPVRAYGFMMALGMAGAVALAWYLAGKKGRFREDILNMSPYVLMAGLAGARLWEVAFSWSYYGQHLAEIPAFWEGGMSVQGSIIGGMLAVIFYTRKYRIPFWELGDIMAPGVLLGQAVGRIGCYLNGCCYGELASTYWGVVYPPGTDAYAAFGSAPLVPAVLYESLWDFTAMGALIFLLPRKPFHGFIATLYFALYAVGRIILEFYRADSLILGGLKTAQATSLLTMMGALMLMLYLWKRSKIQNKSREKK